MFDLKNKNVELKSKVIDEIFAYREENICAITKYDREKIDKLTKHNDDYQKLIELIEETTDNAITKDKVKNSLESYIDGINIVGAYENEKFY